MGFGKKKARKQQLNYKAQITASPGLPTAYVRWYCQPTKKNPDKQCAFCGESQNCPYQELWPTSDCNTICDPAKVVKCKVFLDDLSPSGKRWGGSLYYNDVNKKCVSCTLDDQSSSSQKCKVVAAGTDLYADATCETQLCAPDDSPTLNYYCGTSYADANTRCGTQCLSGLDKDCKNGEKCFADAGAGC